VDIVTTVAQNVHLFALLHMPTLLIGCIFNDALVHATPNVQQALLQFNRCYAPATENLAAGRRFIDRIEASADPVERKRLLPVQDVMPGVQQRSRPADVAKQNA